MTKLFSYCFWCVLLFFVVVGGLSHPSVVDAVYVYSTPKELNITGKVPADKDDYTFIVTKKEPHFQPIRQGQKNKFEIEFGTTLKYPDGPVEIIVEWDLGRLSGESEPSVDVLEYIDGTASKALGKYSPVVDRRHHRLTWIIPELPAELSGKKVTFELNMTDKYQGSEPVYLTVRSKMVTPDVVLFGEDYNLTYQFDGKHANGDNTDANSGGTTSTPSPTSSKDSTQQQDDSLYFTSINTGSISNVTAVISARSNVPSLKTVQYGTQTQLLTETLNSTQLDEFSLFPLTDLEPDTFYFFRVIAQDTEGRRITSDIYSFQTAKDEEVPVIDLESIVVSSEDNILLNPGFTVNQKVVDTIVVPKNTEFEVKFQLSRPDQVQKAFLFVSPEDEHVLGITTEGRDEIHTHLTPVLQIQDGWFKGRLLSLPNPEKNILAIRIEADNGTVIQQKIADYRTIEPLTIINTDSQDPIEKAKISLSFFNENTQLFERTAPEFFGSNNPLYSNPQGVVPLVVPIGRYQIEVSSIGFESKKLEFSINEDDDSHFPLVELQPKPFSIVTFVRYHTDTRIDLVLFSREYIEQVAESRRFKNSLYLESVLVAMLVMFLVVLRRDKKKVKHKALHFLRVLGERTIHLYIIALLITALTMLLYQSVVLGIIFVVINVISLLIWDEIIPVPHPFKKKKSRKK